MPVNEPTPTLRYHHARPLIHVRHGVVVPVRETDVLPAPSCAPGGDGCDMTDEWHGALHMEAAYRWLAERVGFWPLFLAVGDSDDDRRLTGYQQQWSRSPYLSPEPPRDQVMFSWSTTPAFAVHCCYPDWHIVLNSVCKGPRLHDFRVESGYRRLESWVLHPSWGDRDWRRRAIRRPGSVQAVAPMLDLGCADEVWAPSKTVARELTRLGFDHVAVKRLRVS